MPCAPLVKKYVFENIHVYVGFCMNFSSDKISVNSDGNIIHIGCII